jgi:hypothetical protein
VHPCSGVIVHAVLLRCTERKLCHGLRREEKRRDGNMRTGIGVRKEKMKKEKGKTQSEGLEVRECGV